MAFTVADLKRNRIIWIASRVELLREQSAVALRTADDLDAERERLVDHLGYDPSRGESEPRFLMRSQNGTCPVCLEPILMTHGGRIASHTDRGRPCRGSQRQPKED